MKVWRYLPLSCRRVAIRILYPRFPVGAVAIVCDAAGRVLLVRQTYHRGGERWGALATAELIRRHEQELAWLAELGKLAQEEP